MQIKEEAKWVYVLFTFQKIFVMIFHYNSAITGHAEGLNYYYFF